MTVAARRTGYVQGGARAATSGGEVEGVDACPTPAAHKRTRAPPRAPRPEPADPTASRPAGSPVPERVQPLVVDAEVVGDLVHHGHLGLRDHVLRASRTSAASAPGRS